MEGENESKNNFIIMKLIPKTSYFHIKEEKYIIMFRLKMISKEIWIQYILIIMILEHSLVEFDKLYFRSISFIFYS
jgi:hypothetical protein